MTRLALLLGLVLAGCSGTAAPDPLVTALRDAPVDARVVTTGRGIEPAVLRAGQAGTHEGLHGAMIAG